MTNHTCSGKALFFQNLKQFGSASAAIYASLKQVSESDTQPLHIEECDYLSLQQRVDGLTEQLGKHFPNVNSAERLIVFIKMHNSVESVIDYLTALQGGYVALLLDPETSDVRLDALVEMFEPNAIIDNSDINLLHMRSSLIHRDVALLLPTSGSTGAAKHVALSYSNLQSNAESICEYLPIESNHRAMGHLPLFYSYGLSVLNSHLLQGAALVFSQYSVVNRAFWQVMEECKITSFSGVPHTYEMLHKLRFTRRALPHLQYLTQAGGRLKASLVADLFEYAQTHNKRFFVMYGQTEATARMAYCSHQTLLNKKDSIGKPIPGGTFKLVNDELFYQGPNVMLGYVHSRDDLAKFAPIDWLATGDLASVDDDGDYRIIGRKKRFVKMFGHRIDLDQVELALAAESITAYCCGSDGHLVIGFEQQAQIDINTIKSFIHKQLGVHPSVVSVISYESLPILANGKRDYQSILRAALDIPG